MADPMVAIDKLLPATRTSSSSCDLVPVTTLIPTDNLEEVEVPDTVVADIQNVICSFSLRVEVDLKTITFGLRTAEYNPRKCQAVLFRMRYPKTTAMIYPSGRVSVAGSKSEADALYAARKMAKIIQKVGYKEAVCADFKVENIIARVDMEFPVRLEQIAYDYKTCATYEPELFPGCVFRMKEPKLACLVFVTGKLMMSGARNVEEVDAALRIIYPILYKYQV